MVPPQGLKGVPKDGKGNWKGVDDRLLGWDSLSRGLELDVQGPPYKDSWGHRQSNIGINQDQIMGLIGAAW